VFARFSDDFPPSGTDRIIPMAGSCRFITDPHRGMDRVMSITEFSGFF